MVTAVFLLAALILGFTAYGHFAVAAWRGGAASVTMLVAGAPILYCALVAVITASWFLAAWLGRSPRPPEAQLRAREVVHLVIGEWLTLLGSAFRMGVGWWFMREPPPAPAAHPVLLLHGVLCNAGVWFALRRRLCRLGLGPVYTLSYGPPWASIEQFADQLAAKIESIRQETGGSSVALVGHSMGGLVARACFRRYGPCGVAQLITIGTPHAGSSLARVFPGRCLAEMRPGSAWLATLNASPVPGAPPITSIWSWHDSMVVPQASSALPGARNIALPGIGHNALLRDPVVAGLIADLLLQDQRVAPSPSDAQGLP